MGASHETARRGSFSLRFLLVATAAVATVLGYWYPILLAAHYYAWAFWAVALLAGFFTAKWRRVRVPVDPVASDSPGTWIGYAWVIGSALLVGYVVFARHRWLQPFDDSLWPRSFPYTDVPLGAFHDWIDRMYPAPPGSFKYHGEYYTVCEVLDVAAVAVWWTAGYAIGRATRNTGSIRALDK